MSDTPKTDAEMYGREIDGYGRVEWVRPDFARKLERELAAAQDQVRFLMQGIAKQNQEIEQTCGKVLGYPWLNDDQKNFPGSTEKDGVCVGEHVAETIVMELAKKYTAAQARIQRLVEAGDAMDKVADAADDDIREHIQVANYNLNGLLNTGERIQPPNPPQTIHQAGINASVAVRDEIRKARARWTAAKEEKAS